MKEGSFENFACLSYFISVQMHIVRVQSFSFFHYNFLHFLIAFSSSGKMS